MELKKEGCKKGKLYRKNTGVKRQQSTQEAYHIDFEIKNGQKGNLAIRNRHNWGNSKIMELLKEHRNK